MLSHGARGLLFGAATVATAIAVTAAAPDQARAEFVGMLDEHPAIQYALRPVTDRVATLNGALTEGARSLGRDERTGYLLAVLEALDLPVESQLLVFSKTAIQRAYTSPANPRALYFDDSVVVGYIPGAPAIEVAAHDPQQGVVFYTLDQTATASPTFTRRTDCLTCHVSTSTLEVPGVIARSNMVGPDGAVMPQLGSFTVNHQTLHTQRWGGWFLTADTTAPPYIQLGNLANVTVSMHPTSGPAIISNHVFIEWMNSEHGARAYPSTASDAAALMVFDHQMHAMNLMTRLNWEARVAAAAAPEADAGAPGTAVSDRARELADYLLFVGEAPLAVEVTPRAGFAESLVSRAPKDRRGRSLAELELTTRLMRYPCSYLVYSAAFAGLPPAAKAIVYQRMFEILSGRDTDAKYAHLSAGDRQTILEILRETKHDLPPTFGE